MKTIDFRSDTVTLPTEEMRQAMYEAQLGDDGYSEDPTVNRLEEMSAQIMGKETAVFVASGTMANLIAVLTHTRPGNEIILGSASHIFNNEAGGASTLGGVVMHTIPNETNGELDLSLVEQAIRKPSIRFPETTLLCLENTQNRCGGAVITAEYMNASAQLARKYGLKIHLDGARIFNAAVALGVPASELTESADSVCFCLSKGLAAPIGSLLCGTTDYISRARKWRAMVGGAMRQVGVVAAAGIVAIEKMISRLAEDHINARRLADGLASIPGFNVNSEAVRTNIVNFDTPDHLSGSEFVQRMNTRSVKFNSRGERSVRAVTHWMISQADIDEALDAISSAVK